MLIDAPPVDLARIADRYLRTPENDRPVLLYSYLPSVPPVDFTSLGLPRPAPVLPLLIERDVYEHRVGATPPATRELIRMLLAALKEAPRAAEVAR